jgi:3-oxoacyl-[acyl-carrier-protein] synthase II
MLPTDKVLVTIGTPCSMSAVGSTETFLARVADSPEFIGLAAFDAGLVEFTSQGKSDQAEMTWLAGERAGQPATLNDIEATTGARLRANLGIRSIRDHFPAAIELVTDIAARLPHDLEDGGLRRLAGLTLRDIRDSAFKDMHGLFDDDPRLGPSLQAQLFVYAGTGALAALPGSLSGLISHPNLFRVAAAAAFGGLDSLKQWMPPTKTSANRSVRDKFAMRLASALSSHGPALLSAMLAPAYSISRALKNPDYLRTLKSEEPGYQRVTQTPLVSVGACASSAIAFCEVAPQLLFDYPGYRRPRIVLWTAADAALQPDFAVLDAFGSGALATQAKLASVNADRAIAERRSLADCLAPFDLDAMGTVVGHAGSGVLVTTLQFALENFLDVTSIIAGWGQSSEAGGKAHFAGVGFGGENAIVQALDLAFQGHGYTLDDFQYLAAHATGTHTNSKTDLTTVTAGLTGAALRQRRKGELPIMTVGAPKAVGDGHSMGETGLKAVSQAIQYLLGERAVGVPTLRRVDPNLGPAVKHFNLQSKYVTGNTDGGVLCSTQGFGGYNGAIALRAANHASLARYSGDRKVLDAYLEQWPEIRREREHREHYWRRRCRGTLELAQLHRWQGAD